MAGRWSQGEEKAHMLQSRAEGTHRCDFLDPREADSGLSAESSLGEVLKAPLLRAKLMSSQALSPRHPRGLTLEQGLLGRIRKREQKCPGLAPGPRGWARGSTEAPMGCCHLAGYPVTGHASFPSKLLLLSPTESWVQNQPQSGGGWGG